MRTTLGQVRQSRLPAVLVRCAKNLPEIAAFVNQAQQQLILAGGQAGWWGGWKKVVFQVDRCHPYITLPRTIARAIGLDVCRNPIRIQNEFYEFMEAGVGLQDMRNFRLNKGWLRGDFCGALEGYDRGTFPTMRDIDATNQFVQVFPTNPADYGKRVLIGPAKDQNGNYIYTQDGNQQVNGFYLTLAAPFAITNFIVTSIEGVQKDATYGDVLLYQSDATTTAQVLLSRYAPDEIAPSYRRYFINRMPCGCFCHPRQSPCIVPVPNDPFIPVTAMAKLEFIPANKDTDFLIIGNIPALIEECQSIRYASMDVADALTLSEQHHQKAIRLLNQELVHYLGALEPAVNYAPWGTAKLRRPLSAVRNG